MRKFFLVALFCLTLCFAAGPTSAQEGSELGRKLPAGRTMVFMDLDLKDMLYTAEQNLRMVDEEAGGKFIYEVNHLYELGRRLAAKYHFEPQLFDRIDETRVGFVLMEREEPLEETFTERRPVFSEEGGEFEIEGFETVTRTRRSHFCPSLVIETDPETATDFVAEVKRMVEFVNESHAAGQPLQRRDLDVEQGELIAFGNDPVVTVGTLGTHVILSLGNPTDLWRSLMAPPAKKLSDVPVYRRLQADELTPQFTALVNTGGLLRLLEGYLERNLEEARKQFEQHQSGGGGGGGYNPYMMPYMVAQQMHKAFLSIKELFTLDKLRYGGGAAYADVADSGATSVMRLLLSHDEPISPLLQEVLQGSGALQVPDFAPSGGAAMLCRVNVGHVVSEVVKAYVEGSGPQGAAMYQMQMQQMKQMIGADLDEILGTLASDMYLFVELGGQAAEMKPKIELLWGVQDAAAARSLLDTVSTQMAANPQTSQVVSTRTYQETDVHCFGMNAARPETYPDGLTAFAVVVVDRYLTMGSWDYVTGVIRRARASGGERYKKLESLVASHPGANFIGLLPAEFQKKLQEAMQKQADPQEASAAMIEQIESLELDLEDAALEREIKSSLRELVKAWTALQEKQYGDLQQSAEMVGEHSGRYYELKATSEVEAR